MQKQFWELGRHDGEIRMEDERARFISYQGNESEDGIERVFLALERRKTTRGFSSLYRIVSAS